MEAGGKYGDESHSKPMIAAMCRGPGPVYQLPSLVGYVVHDPRSIHHRGPAFSFGVRHGKLSDDASPGPVYFPSPKVTIKGADGTPRYTIKSRIVGVKQFSAPPPGTYSPEKAGESTKPPNLRYSFGMRTNVMRTDSNPAPNTYSLPGSIGKTVESTKRQMPCYSQYARRDRGGFHSDFAKTPGPGTYNVVNPNHYRNKGPEYSLRARTFYLADTSWKPGPGQHSPERVVISKHAAPKYSFGIRHSDYVCPLIIDPKDGGVNSPRQSRILAPVSTSPVRNSTTR